jgi:hypothetical protein
MAGVRSNMGLDVFEMRREVYQEQDKTISEFMVRK